MMTDVVTTYSEKITWHGNQDYLVNYWRKSWENLGWQTRVLGRSDAMKHPLFQRYLAKVSMVPSPNPAGFELACWMRWLAFAYAGGGLMVDYDVINRHLAPGHLVTDPVLIGDAARVPCMVFATSDGAEDIVQRIFAAQFPNEPHFSDMIWFQASPYPHEPLCKEIGTEGWKLAPVRHFSVKGCRGYSAVYPNKLSVMQAILSKE